MDFLKNFFDTYERNARLLPATIILAPTFISLYCLFPDLRDLVSTFVGSILFLSFSYLLGKLARNIGKRKEEKLIEKWDGLPSTRFLRHRDITLDTHTKKRYHAYLERNVTGLHIPTKEEETMDPRSADLIYESAVRWLRTKTRDSKKYRLLFRENISYGFARNFWALKYWGIIINILTFSGTVVLVYNRYNFDLSVVPNEIYFSVVADIIVFLIILFFTEKDVHSKAKAYARTLLEVCDESKE